MMFYNMAYISKVNIASLNGSEGLGGNITPIKKVSDSMGNEYAYVSGQAIRRYLKDTLMELGQRITAVDENGEPDFMELNDKVKGKGNTLNKKIMYESFCDLDLFGYMFPKAGRRWSPVKVAPMISLLPYKGEYDYLTRKKYVENEGEKSGNIVQVEIDTMNFMRGNIMVDVDKIGSDINEYTYEMTDMLGGDGKKERINAFLDAVKYFNGGAKQARNLEDIAPKFMVAIKQRTGNPFLLNSFSMDSKNNLNIKPVIEAINENREIIESVNAGVTSNIFSNEKDIIEGFKAANINIVSVGQAIDTLKL